MSDDSLKSAEAWIRDFQGMDVELGTIVDPVRAAGRVGRQMRETLPPGDFDRQPVPFTQALESFAPDGKAGNTGDDR
jgi:hypothetical protein